MKHLLIGPAWVGDMVMAHSLVRQIARKDPQAQIHVVAPGATAGIAQRMAEVDSVDRLDIGHGEFGLGARWRLGRQLAAQLWDHAYVLPNSWKSALLPWFARAKRRTGWRGEMRFGLLNDSKVLPKQQWPLMIERFMALTDLHQTELAKPYPYPLLQVDQEQQVTGIKKYGLRADGRAIALCPGAQFGPAKQWPAEHFATLAQKCIENGYQVWLLGGPADQEICARISGLCEPQSPTQMIDLSGKTDLLLAVDLLAAAGAVVANDSGLMHIACAVDTPVVAVYGSTSPGFTPPLHDLAQTISLVSLDEGANRLACQPCFQRTCRYGHMDCLTNLSPDAVLAGLARTGLTFSNVQD